MNEISEKTIDVRQILRGKMGAKAKYVPGFIVKWLERILHQDEVNEFLWDNRDRTGVEWLESCLKYLDTTLDIVGEENLPDGDDGRLYTSSATIRSADRTAWRSAQYSDGITAGTSATS